MTSRSDFEKLVDLRMKEAKLLLDQSDWDGAYYLVGYAVEGALKIRIIS
ncbi:MAG: DNA-binding protein, partial [Planctomycetia bacterium 21-64-5]